MIECENGKNGESSNAFSLLLQVAEKLFEVSLRAKQSNLIHNKNKEN